MPCFCGQVSWGGDELMRLPVLLIALLTAQVPYVLAEPSVSVEPDQGNVWSGSRADVRVILDGFKVRRARVVWHLVTNGTAIATGGARMRLRRGHGERRLVIPVPEVERRVSTSLVVTASRGEEVLGRGAAAMTVFPPMGKDEFGAGLVGLDLHVYDPGGGLVALLEKLGISFRRTRTSEVGDIPDDAVVLVGAGALGKGRLSPGEMLALARQGRTLVILCEESLGQEREWEDAGVELLAEPVLVPAATWGARPPRWSPDVDDSILGRWAGGCVGAAIFNRPSVGNAITWLMEPEGGLPLIMELRPGAGRVILCQCPVVEQFDAEPTAQLLFRDLLRYAGDSGTAPLKGAIQLVRQAGDETAGWTSVGLCPELIEAGALFEPDSLSGSAALFLVGVESAAIKDWVKQHLSREEVRRRFFDAGGTLLVCNATVEDTTLMEETIGASMVPGTSVAGQPIVISEAGGGELVRGLTPGFVASAVGTEPVARAVVTQDEDGIAELVGPGWVLKCERGRGRVIVCQVPLDEENEAQRRFYVQFLTNVGIRLSGSAND